MWAQVQRKGVVNGTMLSQNLNSIFTSTQYHQLSTPRCSEAPSWCCLEVVCAGTDANGLNFKLVMIGHTPSQQANSSSIFRSKSLCVQWQCFHSTQTSILPDIETGMTKKSLPRLPFCERLSGLLSIAHEHEALCTSAFGIHFHDHHICGHGPTVFWPILSVQIAHLLCPPGNVMDYIWKMIVRNIKPSLQSVGRGLL